MNTSIGPCPSHTSVPVRQVVATGTVADAARTPRKRRRSSRTVWDEDPSVVAQGSKGIVLVLICLAVMVPLYTIVLTRLSSQTAIKWASGQDIISDGRTVTAF